MRTLFLWIITLSFKKRLSLFQLTWLPIWNLICVSLECSIKTRDNIDNSVGYPAYTPTTLTNQKDLDYHKSVFWYLGISKTNKKRKKTRNTRRTSLPVLDIEIIQVSIQAVTYCWLSIKIHEASFLKKM